MSKDTMISYVNTFAYDLCSFLANVYSPLAGNLNFTVKNSTDFASTIASEEIQDHEIMVSFDVESLFTNVPIKGAVQAALQKMKNDAGLPDRTTLTPVQIVDLLDFVLRSTYFQFNGWIYKQQDGTAMGSPVSAVIARTTRQSHRLQVRHDTSVTLSATKGHRQPR